MGMARGRVSIEYDTGERISRMKVTFNTTLKKGTEKNVSGISVPPDVIATLNSGKKRLDFSPCYL